MSDSTSPEVTDSTTSAANAASLAGSRDGQGAGDHDQPFSGYRPYHFSTRQMLRLLHLRSEVLDARLGYGRLTADLSV
jgi:hypothetical protein